MKVTVWLVAMAVALTSGAPLRAQATAAPVDAWQALNFLQGTWQAKTGAGTEAKVTGTYSFERELKGHVLARHSTVAGCTGPESFDCEHGDLLYLFEERRGQPLKAIYFDNEGHVIHYAVTTPDATTVQFLSEPGPGPRFRLVYHLEGGVMQGSSRCRCRGRRSGSRIWSGAEAGSSVWMERKDKAPRGGRKG